MRDQKTPQIIESNWLMLKGYHDKQMLMNKKFLFFKDDQKIQFISLDIVWDETKM